MILFAHGRSHMETAWPLPVVRQPEPIEADRLNEAATFLHRQTDRTLMAERHHDMKSVSMDSIDWPIAFEDHK